MPVCGSPVRVRVLPAISEMPACVVLAALSLAEPMPAPVPEGFQDPLKLVDVPTLRLAALALY